MDLRKSHDGIQCERVKSRTSCLKSSIILPKGPNCRFSTTVINKLALAMVESLDGALGLRLLSRSKLTEVMLEAEMFLKPQFPDTFLTEPSCQRKGG